MILDVFTKDPDLNNYPYGVLGRSHSSAATILLVILQSTPVPW